MKISSFVCNTCIPPQDVRPQNWGETELSLSVTCMVLKATAHDRRHLALCHDEFRGPLSGLCRSGDIGNNNNNILAFRISGVTKNICPLKSQVLGSKPKYVFGVSQDLSPCDFDLIPTIKEHFVAFASKLLQRVFQNCDSIDQSIRTINRTYAARDVLRLPHRWKRVILNAGDYIEGL
ncbi:uncharacterized protein TNCV_3040241 [Trichonephila clavipes]|nr:uncharacterized protein TNCV_3040241 [Trichonephila clavipes]